MSNIIDQKLNKISIASYLRNVSGFPESLCKAFVNNYFQGILRLTFTKREFLLRYFGKFFLVKTKLRRVNGFVKEEFILEPRDVIKFKSSNKLRDFFNRDIY